jgi:hypothetical protein
MPRVMRPNFARVIAFLVAVAAVVIIMFVTGWADDKAPPGSQGRVPVGDMTYNDSR